ncbi:MULTISPECIES: C40 family peptidase [unclassified Streptomyces]|uniref:C40 family peptidase n=1 Tax=Streptomyces sp. NPDC006544 TaxID=3154583 RepID=UPI0033A5B086
MASHRRPKQPTRTRVTVLTVTAAAAVVLSGQAANAAPAKPSKDEVKSKVDALYEEAEQATEKLNGAQTRQDSLEKEIGQLQDQVARGQGELNTLRGTLGSMANAQYRTGGMDQSLALFLSADPDNYLDKASTLEQLSGKQVEAVQKIQAKQRSLAQQRQEAAGKLTDLDATRKELAEKKKISTDKLAEAQALLNTLTAQERAQLKEEAKKAGGSASEQAELSNVKGSGRAADALRAAVTKNGGTYVRGGTGPNAFDCSGLTQWAYRQAGITIGRTTFDQVKEGPKVSLSELQPGDLVFYSNLQHVGLYAGNGKVFHAANPSAGILYGSLSGFAYGVRVGS